MKINLYLKLTLLFFTGVILLSSYVEAQTQEWVERFNNDTLRKQKDEADFIYVDAHGNSYAGGTAYDTSGMLIQYFTVIKYDSTGTQLWFAMDTSDAAYAYSMAVDSRGEVFFTGYASWNYPLSSFIVVKFDSTGVFQWTKRLGVSTPYGDQGMAITTDANYVYVAGAVFPSIPPGRDYRTVKLDIDSGSVQPGWPQDYNGTGNNDDIPASIAVDASGNVFVTGRSLNGSGDFDFLTIGYSSSGATLPGWPKRWDGPSQTNDTPIQLILSGSNVIVTGICNQIPYPNDTTGDICTLMYTYSGAIVPDWPNIYNGTGNSLDAVGGFIGTNSSYKPMAVDGDGNVYVGGYTTNSAGNYDMIILKYNSSGVIQSGFPVIYDNAGNNDFIRGLALDASNDICVTGWTTPKVYPPDGDYITIEFDNSGSMMAGWPVIYNGPGNGDDQAMAIAVEGNSIWITGYSTCSGTFGDFTTIKYSNSNPTVNVESLPAPASKDGAFVYPNPSSGRFIIANTEARSQLIVTNVLGEIIYQTKVISQQTQVDLGNEAEGIYFYKIIDRKNFVQEGRLIVFID